FQYPTFQLVRDYFIGFRNCIYCHSGEQRPVVTLQCKHANVFYVVHHDGISSNVGDALHGIRRFSFFYGRIPTAPELLFMVYPTGNTNFCYFLLRRICNGFQTYAYYWRRRWWRRNSLFKLEHKIWRPKNRTFYWHARPASFTIPFFLFGEKHKSNCCSFHFIRNARGLYVGTSAARKSLVQSEGREKRIYPIKRKQPQK
ncbi:MAG: hypothetical protein RL308_2406, partial [Bacteroidota bacterium]